MPLYDGQWLKIMFDIHSQKIDDIHPCEFIQL